MITVVLVLLLLLTVITGALSIAAAMSINLIEDQDSNNKKIITWRNDQVTEISLRPARPSSHDDLTAFNTEVLQLVLQLDGKLARNK